MRDYPLPYYIRGLRYDRYEARVRRPCDAVPVLPDTFVLCCLFRADPDILTDLHASELVLRFLLGLHERDENAIRNAAPIEKIPGFFMGKIGWGILDAASFFFAASASFSAAFAVMDA